MSKIFNLKSSTKPDECHAVRCKEEVFVRSRVECLSEDGQNGSGEEVLIASILQPVWGVDSVELCVRHMNIASTYVRSESSKGIPEEKTDIVVADKSVAKAIGWSEGTWLLQVQRVLQKIDEYRAEGEEVMSVATSYEVRTQQDLVDIGAWVQDAKAKLKEIAFQEKEITGPLATALSRIRDLFRPSKQAWVDAEAVLRAHLVAATLREEENNRKATAEAASAHATGGDATEALAKVITTSDIEGISLKVVWKAVVEDASKMPDEYIIRVPNLKMLKEHCSAAGDSEPGPIPGVRFERDVASRVQTPKAVVL